MRTRIVSGLHMMTKSREKERKAVNKIEKSHLIFSTLKKVSRIYGVDLAVEERCSVYNLLHYSALF